MYGKRFQHCFAVSNVEHSVQCMENCFWENVQKITNLKCLVPQLLNNDVNLTKPECRDSNSESNQIRILQDAMDEQSKLLQNCTCPRRCNVNDFQLFDKLPETCDSRAQLHRTREPFGTSELYLIFPSKRVRLLIHILRILLLSLFTLLSIVITLERID